MMRHKLNFAMWSLVVCAALFLAACEGSKNSEPRLDQLQEIADEYVGEYVNYYESLIETDAYRSPEASKTARTLLPVHSEYARRALDIAMLDPTDEAGFQALQWASRFNWITPKREQLSEDEQRKILNLLIEHHVEREDLAPALAIVGYRPDADEFRKAVIKKNPHDAPRAAAILITGERAKSLAGTREAELVKQGVSVDEIVADAEANLLYADAIKYYEWAVRDYPEFDWKMANPFFNPIFDIKSKQHEELKQRFVAYRKSVKPPTEGAGLAGAVPPANMKEYAEWRVSDIETLRIGLAAPDVPTPDLDGIERTLGDYKGKVVVMDFWATWCGPCKIEIPEFQEFAKKYHGDDVRLLSISADFEREDLEDFLEETPMPWDHWVPLLGHELMDAWNINGYPQHVVLDQQGRIRARGPELRNFERLAQVVDSLLAQ